MKLFVFFVTVLAIGRSRIVSIGSCNADDFSDLEFPDDREDCADGACNAAAAAASMMYAEKRMMVPEQLAEHRQHVPRTMSLQDSIPQWKSICGCVTQHKIINLGEGHYPHYISMARCKAKTCPNKFYQCRNHEYRAHVLVKRGMSSILKNSEELDARGGRDVEELTLPDSLQANWQLLAFSIPVACIAVERT